MSSTEGRFRYCKRYIFVYVYILYTYMSIHICYCIDMYLFMYIFAFDLLIKEGRKGINYGILIMSLSCSNEYFRKHASYNITGVACNIVYAVITSQYIIASGVRYCIVLKDVSNLHNIATMNRKIQSLRNYLCSQIFILSSNMAFKNSLYIYLIF